MRQLLISFLFFLSFLFVGSRLSAQLIAPCLPSQLDFGGALTCQTACIYCEIDGVEDATIPPVTGSIDIDNCLAGAPPITLENPRWYGFIAGSSMIDFTIKSLGCQNDEGLEAAILSGGSGVCGSHPLKAISCSQLDPNNPIIGAFGLIPGQAYYLVVDGVNADICKYHIDVTFGSATPPELGPLDSIQGLKKICPGAVTNYSIPPVDFALSYVWTAPAGAKINGGSNNVVIPADGGDAGTTIQVQFGAVGGLICVTASNACDTPKTTCIQVVNQPLAITTLPDITICFEELPYSWQENPDQGVVGPGTYTLTTPPYTSYLGCDSLVRQKIIALPRKQKTLPPKFLCKDECFIIGGFEYCDSGTYQEIISSDSGCDSTVNFILVKIPVNAEAQVMDTLTCKKTSVLLTGTGSSAGNTIFYRWLNPSGAIISNADTAVATAPGLYSLIVTNVAGGLACEDTATVEVIANTTAPMANAGPDLILNCDEPLIQLQGTGSVGSQYTYQWITLINGNIVSGGNTLTPIVNAPGTYRLVVTDNTNGCTSGNNAKVTSDMLPPSVSASGGTYTCITASVTLNVNTNASGPTYAWTGPNGFTSDQANPVVTDAGDYTIVVTDAVSGCTNAAIATVQADTDEPGAEATGGALTCVVDEVMLSGSSPAGNPVFAWTGPNGYSSNIASPVVTASGTYNLIVTGANGCTSTAMAIVTLNDTPPGASLAVSGNLNCNNATVAITATTTDPAPTMSFVWTLPDNSTVTTDDVPELQADAVGDYSVVVTNTANGCTSTAMASVAQSPPVTALITSVMDVLCFETATGTASVAASGGSGNFTYLWSNDETTAAITGLASGNYSVTVTDGEQCTASATATINQPDLLTASSTVTAESANGANDGTASVTAAGGSSPYMYLWSNDETTPDISNLPPGTYMVTVTDDNGCTVVSSVQVLPGDCGLALDITSEMTTCNGDSTGSATVATAGGAGPFTYAWSSGGSEETENDLPAGTYLVTVTDANGCTVSGSVDVGEPSAVEISVDVIVNTMCPDESNGSATVDVNGGTGILSVTWSNNQTGPTASDLAPGVYTAVVTDENGCTNSVDATIDAIDTEAPVISTDPITTPLGTTGNVTLSAQTLGLAVDDNCGISSITFVPASFNCAQLGPHDVLVTATDGAGNETTETVVITVVDVLSPTLDCPVDIVRCAGDDFIQYPAPVAMDNCLGIGGSFAMPSGIPSGNTYPEGVTTNTFTYTDANGNVGTCSFDVTILTPLMVALDTLIDDIDNQGIGSIDIDVSGSLAPYTYVWVFNGDTLPVTTEDLDNLVAGTYQVFITDDNGCTIASEAFTVKSLVDAKEPEWATGLLIVPNPTSGKLSVIFPAPVDRDVQMTVHDMTGRIVAQQYASAPKQVDFDLSSLPGGMYRMAVVIDNQVLIRKIVVSR
ncbi:MAG: T9SS type A sorting domain-containing protein [Saprospiraceae bacterium]|nr:T9SS type A sorting domain-containing protein [Saprospiraceae bacterium]